ncbi:hypothetical protein [Streptomyces longwoodensis]|uniref:hypothetical protein n=1 Tax=Streptomyces longwoodensis TaxID=68231 RepID=UPI0036FCB2F1
MMWPLAPATVAVVAAVTVAASLTARARTRRVRTLVQGAQLSGNRAAMEATLSHAQRVWRQHCTLAVPVILVGLALLTTQAVAYVAVALPR